MSPVPLLFGPLALPLGLLLGVVLTLLWTRRSRRRVRRLAGLAPAQLLRWLEAAPTGWLIIDGDDVVRLLNPRAERLLEVGGPALLHALPLQRVCDAPELAELVRDARRRGRLQRLEWQRPGEELELFALPGEAGWVAVLLQSRRSLEAQLEQQERWVSDVAHELKTPLTALLLVGDSLAAQVNSGNAVLVERLQRELRRLQALVGDLLELSRLENTLPRDGLRRSAVDLPELVRQVWMGLRPLAEPRDIHLELQVEPAEAAAVVSADSSRLHRALLNLLDNAIRFSPDGGTIHVGIRLRSGWCRLSVRDQGPGLSEEDSRRLFERFYRGDPSRARGQQGGTGLGLAIVQQIAHAHGGRIRAGDHPSGGALLELLLPLEG
ncbi:cell wall metabolism sensor histidine kinase WalK [Synechococcus sp. CBW1004]|uniref:sensor histidine kinase n=1 Tax=Synechococcus sp. CBW1004 TaxID=1353136 RepID=UPI001E54BB66|nr:HAMP domain-containing sensor histidine kinase [Synechococcus sp. CBW1004]